MNLEILHQLYMLHYESVSHHIISGKLLMTISDSNKVLQVSWVSLGCGI